MKDYTQYFISDTRTDGRTFIKRSDDTPTDLKDMIFAIHQMFDAMPNDWIYATIHDAFEDLAQDDIDGINIEADCYYSDLYKWFGEPYAHELCNEVMEEGLEAKSVYHVIGAAQERAMDRIYRAVDRFLNKE